MTARKHMACAHLAAAQRLALHEPALAVVQAPTVLGQGGWRGAPRPHPARTRCTAEDHSAATRGGRPLA